MVKKTETTSEHGGARANAGRKAQFNEPTKVIRVPESQVDFIKNWLLQNHNTGQHSDLTAQMKIQPVQAGNDRIYQIPLATERVAAGAPAMVQDNIDQALDMNQFLIRNENSTFVVKANSLSMLNAGIDIDDPLVVDRSIAARHGDIVIALIDNDFTVKRLMIDQAFAPPKVWLKAENPDFKNIYIEEGQQMEIWGVVTYNLKPMR